MGLGIRFSLKRKPAPKTSFAEEASEQSELEQLEDGELVSQSIEGDKAAYQALVRRHQGRLFGRALAILRNREDAKDIVQETFVKAYLSLSSFRGQSSFYTWTYRILVNLSIDLKRKTARRGGDPVELDESLSEVEQAGEYRGPADVLYRKEQSRKIQEVMSRLSEEHRKVVILRELDGLSYEEIAETLGISLGTVMSRLFYARKRLQMGLKEFAPSVVESEEEIQPVALKTKQEDEEQSQRLKDGRLAVGPAKKGSGVFQSTAE